MPELRETGPWAGVGPTDAEVDAALTTTACERCGRDWLGFALLLKSEQQCELYVSAWCLERSVRDGS